MVGVALGHSGVTRLYCMAGTNGKLRQPNMYGILRFVFRSGSRQGDAALRGMLPGTQEGTRVGNTYVSTKTDLPLPHMHASARAQHPPVAQRGNTARAPDCQTTLKHSKRRGDFSHSAQTRPKHTRAASKPKLNLVRRPVTGLCARDPERARSLALATHQPSPSPATCRIQDTTSGPVPIGLAWPRNGAPLLPTCRVQTSRPFQN